MKTIEIESNYKRIFYPDEYGVSERDNGYLYVGRPGMLMVGWLCRFAWPEEDPLNPHPMEIIGADIRLKLLTTLRNSPFNPLVMEVSVDEADDILDVNDLLDHVHHVGKRVVATSDWTGDADQFLSGTVAIADMEQTEHIRDALLGDYPYDPWVIANSGEEGFGDDNYIRASDCTLVVDYYDTALALSTSSKSVHVGQQVGILITRETNWPHYPVTNGSLVVNLVQSGSGGVSSLPPTATIPINETSVLVVVTATTRGGVVITATSGHTSQKTIELSVLSESTGFVVATEPPDTLVGVGSLVNRGLVDVSEPADTLVAIGNNALRSGRLIATEPRDSLSSVGHLLIRGVLNATEASDTLVSFGDNFSPHGRLNVTEQRDVVTASGSLAITARLAITNPQDTLVSRGRSSDTRRGVFVSGDVFRKKQQSIFLGK